MFTPAPKSGNQEFTSDSLRLFAPNLFTWISFELIFLRIRSSENVVSNAIQDHISDEEQIIESSFMIRVAMQIVALN